MDAIRDKYGRNSVKRASTVQTDGRIGRKAKAEMEAE